MSQYNVYLTLPDYLAQWLRHDYWAAESRRVEFPRGSLPRVVLRSVLRPQPPSHQPGPQPEGTVAIEVPTFRGINPAVCNYLSARGAAALTDALRTLFKRLLVDELCPLFDHEVQISNVIYDFLDRHGIEPTEKNWETVRQMYQRLRRRSLSRRRPGEESEQNLVD